jgi:tetratricopeptide (TPR) repeat protein
MFPTYFAALEALGTEYVKTGQYEAALPALRQALTINNRTSKSFYSLGVAHLKLNQLTEAIESLTQSATLDPNNVNTHMMLGIAYSNRQQLKEAEESFQKALKLGGASIAEARFYLASVYEKQRRYDAAIAELEQYLKEAKAGRDPEKIREWIQSLKALRKQKP